MTDHEKAKATIDDVINQICEKGQVDRFVVYTLIAELMEEDGFGEFDIEYLDVTLH